jgi:protein-S-isoprenylcysteine O-methyltransferase Ste14
MMVRFGNLLFHYRNFLFPVFYAALFIPSPEFVDDFDIAKVAGLTLISMGIVVRCVTIGLVYIVRGGHKRQIHAENLVTAGIYSLCRNPMYLGNILLLLGFGLLANSLWFVCILFPVFVIFYIAIIAAEEAFLSNKFGDTFTIYKANVNALIPNLKFANSAFKGQQFKWKKVLSKEHNSLYLYFSGVLILFLYHEEIEMNSFIISFLIVSAGYLVIKFLKKNDILDK